MSSASVCAAASSSAVCYGAAEPEWSADVDHVAAVPRTRRKDWDDRGPRRHGQAQGPFGNARRCAEKVHRARAQPGRRAIDLERNGPPLTQVPGQGQGRERVVSDVRHEKAVRRPCIVLDRARSSAALGTHREHHAQGFVA